MNDFKITKRMQFDFPAWILADETFISQFASLVNLYNSSFENKELLLKAKLTNEVSNMVRANLKDRINVLTREDYLNSINSITVLVKNNRIKRRKQEIEKDFE